MADRRNDTIVSYANGGSNRITYRTEELDAEQKKLQRLQLLEYEVKVPQRRGKGKAVIEIDKLAELMKQLYDQVQELISETVKMLESINITITMTDAQIAEFYTVGNSCYRIDK